MNRRVLLTAGLGVLAAAGGAAAGEKPGPPPGGKGPDLQFTEDGEDLVVRLVIDGPAARQVVLTDYAIDDGTPPWDEPPIGVAKPRRPPRVTLRYLVLVNRDLPGFVDGGLMLVPTPPEVRRAQRQEVTWRLPGYRRWGFRREDATFQVEETRFAAWSEQLRGAVPEIRKTVEESDRRLRELRRQPPP